ncbi:MAG TPA: proline dehydrogenase family protein [Candidatus Kapabacteria bacterium]|nr:proline dehydrogenase family protein [Candidatus Kapabacteria bacterium]
MGVFDSLISGVLPYAPKALVRVVARRYIAGETINDAMNTVRRLNGEGTMATIDALGEFVKSAELARAETETSIDVLQEIARQKVDSNLSVKLTSLGLDIDAEFAYQNLHRVVSRAAELGNFVRIDMENSPYTDRTIELYRRIRSEFPANIGIVLQAYLHRTESDVRALAAEGGHFRLCKGIYVESETIAFKSREEIQQNYLRCLDIIFDHGCYVGIATHDDVLIDGARRKIAERGLARERYEFQMLLGVRDPKRRELVAQGHRLRVYVPFGHDWYGYSIRRLKENPSIAGHVFKAIFTGN